MSTSTLRRTRGEVIGTVPATPQTDHAITIYPSGLVTLNLSTNILGVSAPRYTKHYYAGSQRIASKIGTSNNIGMFNCNWLIIPFGGTMPPINPVTVSNNILQTATQSNLNVMQNNNITPPPSYGQNAGYNGNCVNNYAGVKEDQMYWFHPDHLGSSSYITGIDGEVTQNIEYFPSGEVFAENHRNSNYSPYKFNGKELDAETGYYYYGARYYNPRVSLWLNVDPLADYNPFYNREHYIDGQHNGGVYNSGNLAPYAYTYQNPVIYIDPNGKQAKVTGAKKQKGKCEDCKVINFYTSGDVLSFVEDQVYEAKYEGVTKKQYNELKRRFTTDPGLINDNSLADYELVDRDGSGGVSVNDHVDIAIDGDSGSVVVQDVGANDSGFYARFATLEGHPDAGYINFGAFYDEKAGTLTYRINNTTRANSGLIIGSLASRYFQKKQWRQVLANVSDIIDHSPVKATQTFNRAVPGKPEDITKEVWEKRNNKVKGATGGW